MRSRPISTPIRDTSLSLPIEVESTNHNGSVLKQLLLTSNYLKLLPLFGVDFSNIMILILKNFISLVLHDSPMNFLKLLIFLII
jgi:hypothetical protein